METDMFDVEEAGIGVEVYNYGKNDEFVVVSIRKPGEVIKLFVDTIDSVVKLAADIVTECEKAQQRALDAAGTG